jgi:hypothetical protein
MLSPGQKVPEFIVYANSNPGKVNMGSGGISTLSHVFGEQFKLATGGQNGPCAVPRRRTGGDRFDRRTGAGGGRHHGTDDRVHCRHAARIGSDNGEAFADIAGRSNAGRFRAGLRGNFLEGIGAPKNTPTEIIDKLNREIRAVLADPSFKARFADKAMAASPQLADALAKSRKTDRYEVAAPVLRRLSACLPRRSAAR